ncbi:MAG TPA: hypothetical protein DCZ38_01205, partial [Coxiellaceae bacterium]|nr:hypothetical protein [Coxiellaceae bacterium]
SDRLALMAENVAWLQKNQQLFSEIVEYHKEYKYPDVPNIDVDAALYQIGFIKEHEQLKCNNFHVAQPQEKITLVDRFSAANLRTQAIRVLGRNYPDILMKEKALYEEFSDYLSKIKSGEVLINYKNEMRLTPKAALAEIENLRQTRNLTETQNNLLTELSRYIQS